MAYPYHRFAATNDQKGHQLFWEQPLQTFPLNNGPNFVAGAYLADGSVMSYGSDCTVLVNDKYNVPGPCSVWASGSDNTEVPLCCPRQPANTLSATYPPPPSFPLTIDQELSMMK